MLIFSYCLEMAHMDPARDGVAEGKAPLGWVAE